MFLPGVNEKRRLTTQGKIPEANKIKRLSQEGFYDGPLYREDKISPGIGKEYSI